MKYIAEVDGRELEIVVDRSGEVTVDGQPISVDLQSIDGARLYSLVVDHASHELFIERQGAVYEILLEGDRYIVDVEQERLRRLKEAGGESQDVSTSAHVDAPMPGLVVKLLVAAGDVVVEDQGLLVLEAMKMENEIRSPRSGVVKSVHVQAGAKVNLGDLMLVVEEA